jgi:hypothetical protein
MFVVNNEDKTIFATRGDIVFFSVGAMLDDGAAYIFQPGDTVRFKVYGKKDANNVVLQKDFPVYDESHFVDIILTEQDTRIGETISKPTDYWYEVELNPFTNPQTIIGYDDYGAKVFKLFPEGRDLEDEEITKEDIPFVDDKLDMTSTRPVQNQAIASAIARLEGSIKNTNDSALFKSGGIMTGDINMSGHAITGLKDPVAETDAVNLKYAKANFAPDQYIADLFSLETEEDFEAKIEEIYTNLAYNTCRTFVVNLNTSGTEILRGSWFVTICRFTIDYGYVEITNENYGSMIRRNRSGWKDWETEQPPMVIGVEYRTTERWNGSVVYAKFIEYGKCEDGALLSAPAGATRIVRHIASFGPFLMPVGEKGEDNYAYVVSSFPDVGLRLRFKGVGNYTTYVQMWYIKD